jgi:hypothetical protein
MSHHLTYNDLPPDGETFEPSRGSKLIGAFGAAGLVGLAGSAFFFFTNVKSFAYSWLFAVFLAFTVVCGACFWILLHSASNSGWGVSIRRLFEHLANMVLVVGLLALPLLVPAVQEPLYEWIVHHREAAHIAAEHGGTVKEALHHMSEGDPAHGIVKDPHMHVLYSKYGYLNIQDWTIRFFLYFVILAFIAHTLRRKSVLQDQDGDLKHTISARRFSSVFLFPFGLAVTFAAVDWLMTLDYSWFSTMWGVYIFAGCAWSSMAVMIMLVTWLRGLGYLQKVVTPEHFHLMGKLLFAFTVFWAYIAFSQYFLIWYANITEETRFYLLRNTESWRLVSVFIVVGHFVAPFLILLDQQRKKNPRWMIPVCCWIVFMHVVDIYWNVIPERGPSITHGEQLWIPFAWIGDVFALLAVAGTLGFLFLRGLGKTKLYPLRDPRLLESANVIN